MEREERRVNGEMEKLEGNLFSARGSERRTYVVQCNNSRAGQGNQL